MQTTTLRAVSSIIMFAVAAIALGIWIKQAALFFWIFALLALSLAVILLLRNQPQYWWVALIAFTLGAFVFWLISHST